MDTAVLLQDARKAAGLTQAGLAARAATAQTAVAAYESGAKTPGLPTLKRLLEASGYEVELAVRPRIRRGANELSRLAERIEEDLRAGEEQNALRLLFGFADDFRGSSRPGKMELIRREPPPTQAPRFDAALAGMAEFFAAESDLTPPRWVDEDHRFVEPWWFVSSRPAFHAYTLAHTPAVFAKHGVFIAREVFDRA